MKVYLTHLPLGCRFLTYTCDTGTPCKCCPCLQDGTALAEGIDTGLQGTGQHTEADRKPSPFLLNMAELRAQAATILLLLHPGKISALTRWSVWASKDKDLAELFRAQAAAAYKPLSTIATNARVCALPAASQKPLEMGLFYKRNFPGQSQKPGNSPYPQCVLLCELQPSHWRQSTSKSKGLPSFRSDPKMLLRPRKDHTVHMGTHLQQFKKWSRSL